MNLRNVILAFLAGRYPAAYTDAAITERVNRSGLLDARATTDLVRDELSLLASPRLGALVRLDADPVNACVVWSATVAGVERWTLDGRAHCP